MSKKRPGTRRPSQLPVPAGTAPATQDDEYFEIVAKALRACATYQPKFGQGGRTGMTLEQFRAMYQADLFYNWIGLGSPLMYAAHKAAGGMTSIYRQLGSGCERLFHKLLQDYLGLSATQASWEYEVPVAGKPPRRLKLDGRITLTEVSDTKKRERVRRWLEGTYDQLGLAAELRPNIKGAVFEIRQGYKSKDAKRQNADVSNAVSAYANLYVPVLGVFSTQIDGDVAARYVGARWLLLTGTVGSSANESSYAFTRDVLGYDLAGFFQRTSPRFRVEVEAVLQALLGPEA